MGLMQLLIFALVFCLLAYGAYVVITNFFPEKMRTVALAIVGVMLLVILLVQFIPGAESMRLWH